MPLEIQILSLPPLWCKKKIFNILGSLDNDNTLGNMVDNKITTSFKGSRVVRSVDLEA